MTEVTVAGFHPSPGRLVTVAGPLTLTRPLTHHETTESALPRRPAPRHAASHAAARRAPHLFRRTPAALVGAVAIATAGVACFVYAGPLDIAASSSAELLADRSQEGLDAPTPAAPGTSNHGWGMAVDLFCGIDD
ncbi:MAG: hypothetical protein WKH47_08650, partial [Actinomycetes bacterium]